MQFYLYLLVDPRDRRPFYVGVGRSSSYRVERHLRRVTHAGQVHERIDAIVKAGLRVVAHKFGYPTSGAALLAERMLIAALGRAPCGPLLNKVGGGSGVAGMAGKRHAPETIARIRASCTGQKRSAETRERLRRAAQLPHRRVAFEKLRRLPKVISPEGRERMRQAGRDRTANLKQFRVSP